MDFVTSALLVSWVAIALLAFVVAGLVRQVHQLTRAGGTRRASSPRKVGIDPGRPAPAIDELAGQDQDAVLLFLSDTCHTCEDVLAAAGEWVRREAPEQLAVRAVYAETTVTATDEVVPVLPDRADLFEAYDALATPYAVIVDRTGRVRRSEPVGSASALLELLKSDLPGQVRSS
ncbi:hypothetical protein [Streptomyces sp. NPDC005438]|uniref:hypothetical protein n=1 Tax=Streptomyces sp. NPDC005438 TaxID=3156880 RepID=UPI00339F429A